MYIDWVRHAESCANYLDKKLTDKYETEQYNKKLYEYIDTVRASDVLLMGVDPYRGENALADARLDVLIYPWIDEIENASDRGLYCVGASGSDDGCWRSVVVPNAKKREEVKRASLAYYIKNQMIRSSWLFHPNLSYVGMMQALKLRDFLVDREYDVIMSSATVRTIMTGILSCPDSRIVVCPYINEIENDAAMVGLDRANVGLDPLIIDDVIGVVMDYLLVHGYIDHVVMVDTSLYKRECSISSNSRRVSLVAFRSLLTRYNLDVGRLLVFSHGKIMKELAMEYNVKLSVHPNNTMIYSEGGGVYEKIYDNSDVRGVQYVDEMSGDDVCGLGSLRGKINDVIMGRLIRRF